jgi:predicted transcriptional regulator
MRIRDTLQEKVGRGVTIEVDRAIHDAIGRPNEHKIGALIVTREGEKIIGIIPVIEQTAGPNAYIAGMDC